MLLVSQLVAFNPDTACVGNTLYCISTSFMIIKSMSGTRS